MISKGLVYLGFKKMAGFAVVEETVVLRLHQVPGLVRTFSVRVGVECL